MGPTRVATYFENPIKSLIQHRERSELFLHFLSGQKFTKNAKNGQNAKIENLNETFWVNFKHSALFLRILTFYYYIANFVFLAPKSW